MITFLLYLRRLNFLNLTLTSQRQQQLQTFIHLLDYKFVFFICYCIKLRVYTISREADFNTLINMPYCKIDYPRSTKGQLDRYV